MSIPFFVLLAAVGATVVFMIVFQLRPRAYVDRPEERRVPKVSFGR